MSQALIFTAEKLACAENAARTLERSLKIPQTCTDMLSNDLMVAAPDFVLAGTTITRIVRFLDLI